MKSHSKSERITTAQEIIENQRFEEPYGIFVLRQGIIHAMRRIMAQVTEPRMIPDNTWGSATAGCASLVIPQRYASVDIDFDPQRLLNVKSKDPTVVTNAVKRLCDQIVPKRKLTSKKLTDAVFWFDAEMANQDSLRVYLHRIELVTGFSDQELKILDDIIELGQYGTDVLKNNDYIWWFGDDELDITPYVERYERFIAIPQCQPEPSLRDIIMRIRAAMAKANPPAAASSG